MFAIGSTEHKNAKHTEKNQLSKCISNCNCILNYTCFCFICHLGFFINIVKVHYGTAFHGIPWNLALKVVCLMCFLSRQLTRFWNVATETPVTTVTLCACASYKNTGRKIIRVIDMCSRQHTYKRHTARRGTCSCSPTVHWIPTSRLLQGINKATEYHMGTLAKMHSHTQPQERKYLRFNSTTLSKMTHDEHSFCHVFKVTTSSKQAHFLIS